MEVPGVSQPPPRCAVLLQVPPAVQRVQHLGEESQFTHSCVTLSQDPTAPFSAIKTSPTRAGVVLHPLVLVLSHEAGQV